MPKQVDKETVDKMIEFIETVYSQLGDAKQDRNLTVFEFALYNGAEKIVKKLK